MSGTTSATLVVRRLSYGSRSIRHAFLRSFWTRVPPVAVTGVPGLTVRVNPGDLERHLIRLLAWILSLTEWVQRGGSPVAFIRESAGGSMIAVYGSPLGPESIDVS